ncbi:MAG: electron transport complex subunit RsxC [bacterium]|nr:electron transport complex subunit RsxC [bacterium]
MSFSIKRFKGGVHPWEGKELTESKAVKTAPLLDKYYVILQQNIGAPPKVIVSNGEEVKKGQILAASGGFVSASVHSPTSGKVKLINWPGPSGGNMPAIELTSDGKDEWISSVDFDKNWETLGADELKKRIADAGVVGMGGAAFPTIVKLSPPSDKYIDSLVINGAECEPFLTADHRLMVEETEKILQGVSLLSKILGTKNVYIGIESNKPDAIKKLIELAVPYHVNIIPLKVKYPQGAEKQLIYAITGREVPCGGLPMDVGCVVQNVATAAAVSDAVIYKKPLIERITTITGTTVCNPGNWKLRIGTPIGKALEFAGGINKQPAKMLLGGPMMGQAQSSLDVPITKNASGLLLLAENEIAQYSSHPCIKCGRCVDVCPMALLPGTLSVMIESENFGLAEYTNVIDCMECGSCAYVCPALRPLVQHFKRGKVEVLEAKKKR